MKKLLSLFQVLENMSKVPRTGGILFSGIDPDRTDSIAEHSFKVSYLCLALGELAKNNGLNINMERLLTIAITHDWEDIILLDIPSGSPSYKSYFESVDIRKIFKKAGEKAKQAMQDFLKDDIVLNLNEKNLSDTESEILKIADTIALLLEILEWKYQGLKYQWFDYVWSNTLEQLRKKLTGNFDFLKPLLNELEKAYESGVKPPNPFLTKPDFQTYRSK